MSEDLKAVLDQLHAALRHSEDFEPEDLAKLQAAAEVISATLDRADVDSASLASRLQEQVESFTDSHPSLARTVGRVADMLAQMGI